MEDAKKEKKQLNKKHMKLEKDWNLFLVRLYWVFIICTARGYFFLAVHRVQINLFSPK